MGIAVVVVIVVIVFVAMGRGDGLSVERNDYVALDLGPVSATDVALLRPPTGLWGYSMQATDEAMDQIAESIRERDVRIVALEQLVTDLSRQPAAPLSSPYITARHRRASLGPGVGEPPATAPSATVAPSGTAPWEPSPPAPWAEPPPPWTEAPVMSAEDNPAAPPEQSHD
jgi:hypothetical protein